MKRIFALLLVLPSIAMAQMYGPPYNPSNTQINGQPAGTMANQNANAVAITGGTAAFTGVVSATQSGGNGVTITPAANGGVPSISSSGANANVSLNIGTQGSGGINLLSSTAVTGTLSTTGNSTIGGALAVSGSGTSTVGGSFNVAGSLSSSANTGLAGVTNSGVALNAGGTYGLASFYDASRSANNRTAEWIFINGQFQARFMDDAHGTALIPLEFSGGQGSGITGITSNSGSGSWSHTGDMAVSGNLIAGSGTLNVYSASGMAVTTPHMVTGTVTLASGAATATFSGSAVFSSTGSYNCVASDTTSNSAVKVAPASASSVSFEGATTDVISYQCIGD